MNITENTQSDASLSLSFGLTFEDLYQRDGIAKLDGIFLDRLKQSSLNFTHAFSTHEKVPLPPTPSRARS